MKGSSIKSTSLNEGPLSLPLQLIYPQWRVEDFYAYYSQESERGGRLISDAGNSITDREKPYRSLNQYLTLGRERYQYMI